MIKVVVELFQSGYDSRESGNYYRIPFTWRLGGTNAGHAGRWAFHLNNSLPSITHFFLLLSYRKSRFLFPNVQQVIRRHAIA